MTGAGDGNRTRVSSLGSWRSTIELHRRAGRRSHGDRPGARKSNPTACPSGSRLPQPEGPRRYPDAVLLSDRDIRAEIESGRVRIDPWDPEMVQPSSIDVRLDKFFRLFDNHKYPVIDPSQDQADHHLDRVHPVWRRRTVHGRVTCLVL